MEKDDFLEDDFIKNLIKKIPEEVPSDNFVENVMSGITMPEVIKEKKPFFLDFKAFWPYSVITFAVFLFLFTSDLPLGNSIPGRDYFVDNLMPYFSSIVTSFKSLYGKAGDLTIPIMIASAAALFFFIDKLLQGNKVSQQSAQ